MNEGWIALLSAILTTIGVKAAERIIPSSDRRMDDAAQIRQELRKEVSDLRDYVDKIEAREDELRARIRTAEDENHRLNNELLAVQAKLNKASEDVKNLEANRVKIEAEKAELKEDVYRKDREIDRLSRRIAGINGGGVTGNA